MKATLVVISLLGFLVSLPLFAAQSPVSIRDGFDSYHLSDKAVFFEDESLKVNIEQAVEHFDQGKFKAPEDGRTSYGFSDSAWWMARNISVTGSRQLEIYFTQQYANIDRMDFWLLDAEFNIVSQGTGGDFHENQHNVELNRLPVLKTTLQPGEYYLFLRSQTQGSMVFNVWARSTENFHLDKLQDYVILSSLIAVLVIMFIYNFFIWLELRKPTYLLYVIFVASMIAQPLSYSGLTKHLLADYSFFMNTGFVLSGSASILLAVLFTYFFLSLRQRSKWMTWICIPPLSLSVASLLTAFSSYDLSAKLALLAGLTATSAIFICGVTLCFARYRPAYFYTLAWLSVIVANFVRLSSLGGLLPVTPLTEWGVLLGSAIEVALISLALADKVRLTEKNAFNRINTLNEDLQIESKKVKNLNDNLEKLVEEQIREIKSIMRNIQLGIIVIKGDELKISDTHSEAVKGIFKVKEVEGLNAISLLFQNAIASNELKDQVASVVESCIDNDLLNFISNEHLLPLEMNYSFNDERKYFQLGWQAVVDEDNVIEKIIVTVKDMTAQKLLEESAKQRETELEYIGEILEVSTRQFSTFMSSSIKFIEDNKRLILLNKTLNSGTLKLLFINLHTIKGAARALGFKHLTPVVHDVEKIIEEKMRGDIKIDRDTCLREHDRVEELLRTYENLNSEKLGRSSSDEVGLPMQEIEKVRRLLKQFEEVAPLSVKSELQDRTHILEDLTYMSASQLFKEVLSDAEMLARDLEKEHPNIEVDHESIYFSQDGQNLIRNAFVHITRNSMDHGIEDAETRLEKGKPAEGTISVSLEKTDQGSLLIRYADDGQGLNLGYMRNLAISKGVINESVSLKNSEISQLVFHPGFSTAQGASEISGRGVGMSAIREYFEQHQGSVTVSLLDNDDFSDMEFVSFELHMILPDEYFIKKENETLKMAV